MTVIALKNRNSKPKYPEIDSLYVYQTKHKAKFMQHQERTAYKYINHKTVITSEELEIYTYHRTATIRGVNQGLTMVTKNGKFRQVQKWFNEQIKAIEADDGLFEKFSKAGATPVELGLLYTY